MLLACHYWENWKHLFYRVGRIAFILSLQSELKADSLKGQLLKFLSPIRGSYLEWKCNGNWRGIHQIQFH